MRAAFQPTHATADRQGVRLGRTSAVGVLTTAALAALVSSASAAYATFDFWEGGPVLASILVFGAASAGAVYLTTRRLLITLAVAVCLVAGDFVLLLAITLGRWER
jgi:hypothetical protein